MAARSGAGKDVSCWLLRGLGVVYLVAFTSLRRQVRGLYGHRGITPLRPTLAAADPAVPSLLWLDASDRGLVRLCTVGQVSALALTAGVAPKLAAWTAWSAHVSFVAVGSPFLDYQWDALLNEAGLVGAVAAPARWRIHNDWAMGRLPRWLFRLLAFRLHFQSGLAKVQSRDPTWRRGTACAHHYQTQPLPTPLAVRARRLPRWCHRLATASVLLLETAVPWLIFAPRRARRLGLAGLEGLQAAIALTGNFAYFNLLTAVVTLSLAAPADPTPLSRRQRRASRSLPRRIGRGADLALGGLVGVLALADLVERVWPGRLRWRPLDWLREKAMQLRTVSTYGLFANMTCVRTEIVIEGSDDGRTWREYELPHKPGDLRRPPRWVAPGHPRLDWQLWFAALHPLPPPWFHQLLGRLLEGSAPVLALFARNPFPHRPPRYVRALRYHYRMTDAAKQADTGQFWQRELIGVYRRPCQLVD